MITLLMRVQEDAMRHALWRHGSRILIGISGGPDSVCLFLLLVALRKKYNLTLFAAHVNYGLRGAASKEDERFVRALANKYAVPLAVDVVAPSSLARKGTNREEAMRDLRYAFFEKIRRSKNCDAIAVAHTQDDQAETFLLALLRGAGRHGLRAMAYRTGAVIRPLLAVSRKDILSYLKNKRTPFCRDVTNRDVRLTRNRVRHRLLPYLAKNFNPSVRETLATEATLFADEDAWLHAYVSAHPLGIRRKNIFRFSAHAFGALPAALQRLHLREMIAMLSPSLRGYTHGHIEELRKAIMSTKNKLQRVSIFRLKMMRKGDTVKIIFS